MTLQDKAKFPAWKLLDIWICGVFPSHGNFDLYVDGHRISKNGVAA